MKRIKKYIFVCILLLGGLSTWFVYSNNNKVKTVGLQPLDGFPQVQLDSISEAIRTQYGFKVVLLPSKALPESCFINIKSPRYRADKLLRYLKSIRPDTIDYMLGLTTKDISTTKKDNLGRVKEPKSKYEDWGIFGLGYRPGKACVVSSYRLAKPGRTIERLQKVSVHELGHNQGLDHCTSKLNCVMDDAAESIKTIDAAGKPFCESCRKKISIDDGLK